MEKIENILIVLLMLLVAGCEKVIDFDIEDVEPYVVVMSMPDEDSTMSVRMTYSRFFLSTEEFETVAGANVSLIANGTKYSSSFDNGRYVFTYQVKAGDALQLEAVLSDGQVVKANTQVPQKPAVSNVEQTVNTLRFTLSDPAGEQNYYRITIQVKGSTIWVMDSIEVGGEMYYIKDTTEYSYERWFSSSDAVFANVAESPLETDDDVSGTYFTDELFNGQQHTFTLQMGNTGYGEKGDQEYVYEEIEESWLVVESLSRELYRYRLSTELSDNTLSLFAEPVQIESNIENGIGIFGATAKTRIPLWTSVQKAGRPSEVRSTRGPNK